MSSFRSLAQFDSWPYDGGGFEVLRPRLAPPPKRLSRASQASLSAVVRADVIPRLVRSHADPGQGVTAPPDEVMAFARYLVNGDITAAQRLIARLRDTGTPLTEIYLRLFTDAARHLGDLWVEDVCDFSDVTLALINMRRLLRTLSSEFAGARETQSHCSRRALLIAAPGDDHDFGIALVQEFFRRDGWDVESAPNTYDAVLRFSKTEPCDVIGLSVSNDTSVDGLAAIVRAIRKSAASTSLKVLVGGRFFLEHPDFVCDVGADGTATDGRGAVTRVSSLLDTSAMQY